MRTIYGLLIFIAVGTALLLVIVSAIIRHFNDDRRKVCRNCGAYDKDFGYCWLKNTRVGAYQSSCTECKGLKNITK